MVSIIIWASLLSYKKKKPQPSCSQDAQKKRWMLRWKRGLEHRCEIVLETCVISPPAHLSPPARQPLLSQSRKHLAFLPVQQSETVCTRYPQPLLYICPYHLWHIDCVNPSENIFLTSWIGAVRNAVEYITSRESVSVLVMCKGGSNINILIIAVKAKWISIHFQQDPGTIESRSPANVLHIQWSLIPQVLYSELLSCEFILIHE